MPTLSEAESKRLQGEGIAKQRTAIAQGLKDSVKMVADAAGVNPSEVLQTVLLTQYFDTMKEIGVSAGSKVILVPHSAGGMNDVATSPLPKRTTSINVCLSVAYCKASRALTSSSGASRLFSVMYWI